MVLLVTLLVKADTFPITCDEKACVPLTIEAAKAAPGSAPPEPRPPEGTETPPEGAAAACQPGS